jgi:hypothetical protein
MEPVSCCQIDLGFGLSCFWQLDVNVNCVEGESVPTLAFPAGPLARLPDLSRDLGMPVRTTWA